MQPKVSPMACEKCGFSRSVVVITRRDPNGYTIRRRRCLSCNHRYYTIQTEETVISSYDLKWKGSSKSNNELVEFTGTL